MPVVLLGAKQEVHHEDGDSGTNHNHEAVAEEEESKHVIDSAEPNGAHDEVELNEDGTERQETNNQHAGEGLEVGGDRGDLARDLVGAHGSLKLRSTESKPRTGKRQRDGDDEPDGNNDEHGGEGNGAGRLLSPQEEIQEEEGPEDDGGNKNGGKHDVELPLLTLPSLVGSGRDVAADEAEDCVQENHDGAQRSTVRGREEAKKSEDDGAASHDEKLRAVSGKDREQKGSRRGSEDVAVDELPAGVFLNATILERAVAAKVIEIELVQAVVASNILLQGSDQDGHDSEDQDDDNDGGIDEPEPVDLGVKDVQVLVPSSGPSSVRLAPVHAVAELDVLGLAVLAAKDNGLAIDVAVHLAAILVGVGLDNNANNTELVRVLVDFVVLDNDFVVVVEKDVIVVIVLSEQEAGAVENASSELVLDLLTSGEPVDEPVQAVALLNALLDELDVLLLVCSLAEGLAGLVLAHLELEGGGHDAVSEEDAAQTLRHILGTILGLTELEGGVVVVVGDDGVQSRVLGRGDRLNAVDV